MEITVQQVELLSDDDYIYLDVRGEIAYQHGHIPKAYEWAGDFSHIEELPKDKRLIVYCNYGEKSAPIAEQLRQEGYEALKLIRRLPRMVITCDIPKKNRCRTFQRTDCICFRLQKN